MESITEKPELGKVASDVTTSKYKFTILESKEQPNCPFEPRWETETLEIGKSEKKRFGCRA